MRIELGTLGQWIGGGFLGAILSLSVAWYLTRPTTVTYTLTTTTLGADPTVKSVIPDLKIQIGPTEVAALHTHSIQISAVSGRYVEKANLAVQWDAAVKWYGKVVAEAPSLSHNISCQQQEVGVTCSLSPITRGSGPYRIALVTDQSRPPAIQLVAKDVELVPVDVAAAGSEPTFWKSTIAALIGVTTMRILLSIIGFLRKKRG